MGLLTLWVVPVVAPIYKYNVVSWVIMGRVTGVREPGNEEFIVG